MIPAAIAVREAVSRKRRRSGSAAVPFVDSDSGASGRRSSLAMSLSTKVPVAYDHNIMII
jgi:hypothetical protein